MDGSLRTLVVAVVALPLGAVLGMLFVPDPTSTLAYALAAIAAVAISTGRTGSGERERQ